MPGLLDRVLAGWAAAIALWALPYLTLRRHLGIEATEALQWSLVIVGAVGTVHALCVAWRASRERTWRASHGLLASLPTH